VAVEYAILEDVYRDSVELMRVADEAVDTHDLSDAFALMGTDANRKQAIELTALEARALSSAGPEDLILVAVASESERATRGLSGMRESLESGDTSPQSEPEQPPISVPAAVERADDPAVALVSVPGEYAVREAWLALHAGLHVHLFSDNVSVADERELKQFGRANDQLVMGPDCGTAIVDGIPLGFANEVTRGSVGIVSASGTGLQEVATLVDRAGFGISQAIGAGGRDLQDAVGGVTTRQGIELLDADDATEVIVVVSKPPEPAAREAVLEVAGAADTPVVVRFLGTATADIVAAGARPAETLAEAATLAATTAGDTEQTSLGPSATQLSETLDSRDGVETGGDLRGLFSGGTLCAEAALVAADYVDGVQTNVGVGDPVGDPLDSSGHVLVDFGVDEFTRGKPHPLLDPGLRDDRLAATLADDDVGVVLLDIVLGRGVHEDPAAGVVAALDGADSPPPVVASVCGTDTDPQSRTEQVGRLRDAGVVVAPATATAAAVAGETVANGGDRR
jgi:FdrA protein